LNQRTTKNQCDNNFYGIGIDDLSQHKDRDDKSHGTPYAKPAVAFFFFAQDIHGKSFQKGNDGRVKNGIKEGNEQHGPEIGGVKEKDPQQGAGKTTQNI